MESGSVLLTVAALVVGYVLLSLMRAILFPPKVKPLEYKPRQVGHDQESGNVTNAGGHLDPCLSTCQGQAQCANEATR